MVYRLVDSLPGGMLNVLQLIAAGDGKVAGLAGDVKWKDCVTAAGERPARRRRSKEENRSRDAGAPFKGELSTWR